jgi:hypothetical protein
MDATPTPTVEALLDTSISESTKRADVLAASGVERPR